MTAADTVGRRSLVRSTVTEGVATVTLDSPGNRNALSAGLCAQLLAALTTVVQDDEVRVVVLTHTGPVFCAGADLKEDPERKAAAARDFSAVLELLWTCPKPVVARLAGPVRAGGTGLVAACDFAVAVDTVSFAFTEVRIGVVPAVISVPLRHRVVPHALYRLFLTGETFDAPHAASIGLLSAVAPVDGLDAEIDRLVEMLLLSGPQAWTGTKQLLRSGSESITAELSTMQELSAQYFRSDEAREGIRSFAERRRPAWALRS
ncbi:enoyl-CoA hydratase-related protein [Rhodococcus chondri]|uniref:Enoyl-CoA hydratase-related protein n=1 Tax=Rhodococcus chondri TaxID=3065941 RepID=A0ABU7JMJ1_9NOCA|nr:enoyl-CoA hydratase-related protein [Rhodococcus sp. CC-R104]MEE2031258.1 enoyl-CoA hydratase-related protein [Rhodococcus sp. CC-R104]